VTELLETVHEFESRGGEFVLDGERVHVKYPPDLLDVFAPILATLRANRQQVEMLIRERHGVPAPPEPPALPRGVRLIRYAPKEPPVAVAPVSIVTNVDKFIRHHLAELDARLNHSIQIRGGGSVFEILAKLAEVGLELRLEWSPDSTLPLSEQR
jgi:hypothetical protein